jgi:hypothetical protein
MGRPLQEVLVPQKAPVVLHTKEALYPLQVWSQIKVLITSAAAGAEEDGKEDSSGPGQEGCASTQITYTHTCTDKGRNYKTWEHQMP